MNKETVSRTRVLSGRFADVLLDCTHGVNSEMVRGGTLDRN